MFQLEGETARCAACWSCSFLTSECRKNCSWGRKSASCVNEGEHGKKKMFTIFFSWKKNLFERVCVKKNRYYRALVSATGGKNRAFIPGEVSSLQVFLLLKNSTLNFKNFMKFHCCKLANASSLKPAGRPSPAQDAKFRKSILILGSESQSTTTD